jgi:lambda family phage minor tail protein L
MTTPEIGLTTEGLVSLFVLDTTMFPGGQLFYFASLADFETEAVWGGQVYAPLPMDVTGFEYTTRGTLPQPTITISNLYGAGNTLIDEYKGLVGALVTRTLTLSRFLDSGETPDPNAYISRDTYVVSQKTSHTAVAIAFKLTSRLDQEGSKIPKRQILRDVCSHSYRVYDPSTGDFNYSKATCPYTGTGYFDPNNNPTTPDKDACGRFMTGCTARFGALPLPARFFPGVGRVQ